MRRCLIAVALALFVAPAFAQQSPDPATLQKAIAVLQAQRNQAMDQVLEANLAYQKLAEDRAKLQAELDELKKKAEPPPKP